MLSLPDAHMRYPSLGLFPTYCLDRDQTKLRITVHSGSKLLLRTQLGKFQSKEVAVDQVTKENNILISTAHIDTLQSMKESDATYDPSSEMQKVSEKLPRVGSGILVTFNFRPQPPPIFPQRAKDNQVTGSVVLLAVIGRDGHVHSLRPTKVPDTDLTIAAIAAVKQWTYKPYLLNGEPVDVETTITVNFDRR